MLLANKKAQGLDHEKKNTKPFPPFGIDYHRFSSVSVWSSAWFQRNGSTPSCRFCVVRCCLAKLVFFRTRSLTVRPREGQTDRLRPFLIGFRQANFPEKRWRHVTMNFRVYFSILARQVLWYRKKSLRHATLNSPSHFILCFFYNSVVPFFFLASVVDVSDLFENKIVVWMI